MSTFKNSKQYLIFEFSKNDSILKGMKYYTLALLLYCATAVLAQQLPSTSTFIKIDQFGYLPGAKKVAVISDPVIGYNAGLSFTAGASYEVRRWSDGATVYTGTTVQWNNGATHGQSGDRGWWFDFSSVSTVGDYYIFDTANQVRSHRFQINPDVYSEVLKTAGRMFYYNRSNIEKAESFAGAEWTDATSFEQDIRTRYVFDKDNANLEKDLRGGWFDAGDYNKYVTFTDIVIHDLLWAYQDNPAIFTDNWNIPESNNGIPDIIDEIKWELDWLLKMNNPDGSTHLKMGSQNYSDNNQAPPSVNTQQRYYGPTCTAAEISVTGVFAHAAEVFSEFPALTTYASTLQARAQTTWSFVIPKINAGDYDTACDNGEIVAGDADWSAKEQDDAALVAAVHLYELTGQNNYRDYIIQNMNATQQLSASYWNEYTRSLNEALLHFTTLPGVTTQQRNQIRNSFQNHSSNQEPYGESTADLYLASMPNQAYHWGSNQIKAGYGVANLLVAKYNIQLNGSESFVNKAADHVHYMHGINPLGVVYLSNMGDFGAEESINELYHQWYTDGSSWDHALTSTFGPAPGYVPGGPNESTSVQLSPPANQPAMKSYLDFNTSNNTNPSWEISEPAIYYQSVYFRLLAAFSTAAAPICPVAGTVCDDGNPNTINDQENGNCTCVGTEPPTNDCIQIENGNFSTGIDPWFAWNSEPQVSNGRAQITSINQGAAEWDAGFGQDNLTFDQGEIYELSFSASAASNRNMFVKIGVPDGNNTTFLYEEVFIYLTTNDYTITLDMTSPSTSNGSLYFFYGHNSTDFYLDDIVIESLGCAVDCPETLHVDNPLDKSFYQASQSISSDATLLADEELQLRAGFDILLEEGFEVRLQSVFSAEILDCQ